MDIKKEITDTLAIISAVLVSGDAVDYVAAARSKLKAVIRELDEKEDDSDG